MAVGLRHWVKLAKKSTRQTTRLREYLLRREINVVLTFSAEAIAELAGCLR